MDTKTHRVMDALMASGVLLFFTPGSIVIPSGGLTAELLRAGSYLLAAMSLGLVFWQIVRNRRPGG